MPILVKLKMLNFNFFNLTRVGGWINLLNIKLFYDTANFFKKKINILEIGSHHGRSLIPLIKGARKINNLMVMDIFEKQKLNISKSGSGNKEIFYKNLSKFNIEISSLQIIDDSSSNYKKHSKKLNKIGYFDIIHIDGGHSIKEVKNDLRLAQKYSTDNTIFILDDIFNPSFPEVIQGFFDEKNKYQPIFLTDQKIFFTKKKARTTKFLNFILNQKKYNKKIISFLGKKTFYIFDKESYFQNYLTNKLQNLKSLFDIKYHF